jgi:hypothetical protein
MLRPLEKQFEPVKAARLKRLVERLSQFSFPPGASRYYGLELASCIEAGALLAALVVGSSLLELYVRALVVNYASRARLSETPKHKSLESALEENRKIGFGKLVDNLVLAGLFEKSDGESAKELYKNIRIPLLHGLPRRFVHQHQSSFAEDLALLFGREAISSSELEAIVEDHALEYLEDIVGIIERNRF